MKQVTIDRARALAKEHSTPSLIIIQCNGKSVGYTSYGADRRLCQNTRKVANALMREASELFARHYDEGGEE